ATRAPSDTPAVSQPQASPPAAAQPQPSPPAPAPTPAKASSESDRVSVAKETSVFATPQGGQYGTLQIGAPGRVLRHSGQWVLLQLEGWVRESDLEQASGGALTGITAAEVRSDPSRYVGRTVEWRLQL